MSKPQALSGPRPAPVSQTAAGPREASGSQRASKTQKAAGPRPPVRRLAWFAGGFSAGVFLAQYLFKDAWPLWMALACLALGLAAPLLPWEDGPSGALRRRGVLLCAALALGLGWSWLYARQVQQPVRALDGRTVQASATVLDWPEESAHTTRVLTGLGGIRTYLYGAPLDLEPGETVSGTLRLQDAGSIRDEGITAFTSKGVFLLAYSRGGLTAAPGTSGGLRWLPQRLARALRGELSRLFQGDAAGVLAALLTGDRSGLSDRAAADFSASGLAHALAVSGMHCGVLLAFLTLLTGKGRLRALTALPVLALYALLTGARPSVVRACVMMAFLLLGPLFRRETDPPTALLSALFLILLQNPFAVASVGLQLSFAAVAGLLWLTPKLTAMLPRGLRKRKGLARLRGQVLRGVLLSLSVTAGALVFTLPLSAWYFGTLSLVSPLSNLLCLWAVSGLFCLGLTAAALGLLCPPLGGLLAIPASWLARYVLDMTALLAKAPALYFSNPYLKYWLAYVYILFAAACLFRRAPARKYGLAAALAGLTLLLTVRLGAARFQSGLDAVILDVGQGQSVILASGGRFALVDCGSANSWYDPAAIALGQLRTMGCKTLDCLVLTHSDSDHTSGVPGLLDHLEVRTVLLPPEGDWGPVLEAARAHDVAVDFLTEPRREDFGRAVLTVLPPVGSGADNDSGLSVLASAGDKDFLLTGDMGSAGERKLLEAWDLPDIEALAAGHHGSKYSTCDEFLEALQPETVCISVGSNAYGHPAQETLARLARQDCTVLRTDRQGTLHLSWNREEAYGIYKDHQEKEEGTQ